MYKCIQYILGIRIVCLEVFPPPSMPPHVPTPCWGTPPPSSSSLLFYIRMITPSHRLDQRLCLQAYSMLGKKVCEGKDSKERTNNEKKHHPWKAHVDCRFTPPILGLSKQLNKEKTYPPIVTAGMAKKHAWAIVMSRTWREGEGADPQKLAC